MVKYSIKPGMVEHSVFKGFDYISDEDQRPLCRVRVMEDKKKVRKHLRREPPKCFRN